MEDLEVKTDAPIEAQSETPDPRDERIGALEAQIAELAKTNRSLEKNVSRSKGTAEALAEIKHEIRLMKAAREDEKNGLEPQVESAYQRELRAIEKEKATPQVEDDIPPDVKMAGGLALKICGRHGWNETSPQYKRAIELGPDKGLDYLIDESSKIVAKTERDKVELAHKSAIKENGGTGAAGGPSAAGDDDTFLKDYSEGRSSDHARAKKLLGI